jgi:hypothetical protein
MALIRLAVLGAAGYGIYHYFSRTKVVPSDTRTHDGLAAIYETRAQAELAVEHLVQELGVDRSAIFVEPVEEKNTSGVQISGGDAPSGEDGSRARSDAPLNGAIRVTVATTEHKVAALRGALTQAGASSVQAF